MGAIGSLLGWRCRFFVCHQVLPVLAVFVNSPVTGIWQIALAEVLSAKDSSGGAAYTAMTSRFCVVAWLRHARAGLVSDTGLAPC